MQKTTREGSLLTTGAAYGRTFWLAYASNALMMIAIGLLFRYADFVSFLGGGDAQLGFVVGIGMVGSLAMRVAQGVGIDRYGPRRIWLASLVAFVLSQFAHLLVTSAGSPLIFAIRIVMQTSVAGVFGSSITYISRRVPPQRMAEIIGTLGTSGFVGIWLGPQLGDAIFGEGEVTRQQLHAMFLTTAGLGCLAMATAWMATLGVVPPARRRRPPALPLLRRYQPGVMLLVAATVGAGISIPHTFLRSFAAERDIQAIGLFFAVYAFVAFSVRILARRFFERTGPRPWIVIGLSSMAVSGLLYLIVSKPWHLIVPGTAAGIAHAVLFPTVVAGGSTAFPERHRGLGTTLMLSMFDVGALVGAPIIGTILHVARWANWPAYPTMLVTVSIAIMAIAWFFATRPQRSRRMWPSISTQELSTAERQESNPPVDKCRTRSQAETPAALHAQSGRCATRPDETADR